MGELARQPQHERTETDTGRPRCPAWLDQVAKRKWQALIPELEKMGLLTVIDGDALAASCVAWSELQHATETLAREGRVFKTASGYLSPHPAVAMQRSAWKAAREFEALFGLDPSSRSRLTVPHPDPEPAASEQFWNEGKGRFSRVRYADPDSGRQSDDNRLLPAFCSLPCRG